MGAMGDRRAPLRRRCPGTVEMPWPHREVSLCPWGRSPSIGQPSEDLGGPIHGEYAPAFLLQKEYCNEHGSLKKIFGEFIRR